MKILIITFSKGINPGTYMQALGVLTAMKRAFPMAEVQFLDFPDFKKHKHERKMASKSLKTFFLQKFNAFIRLIKYNKNYNKTFKQSSKKIDLFNYDINEIKSYFENFDLISIGSDTILEDAQINNVIGLNWIPSEINTNKVFFAASASPARIELNHALKHKLRDNVNTLSFIGVRDLLTQNFLCEKLNISIDKIVKQPDPTYYLNEKSFSLPLKYVKKLKNKKIALYNFNVNFPYRKEFAFFLKEKGYTLVSTFYNPYVDIQLARLSAEEWAGVFKYCTLVVTERFHDSLFALRNLIPVVSIDWDKGRFSDTNDSKTYRILEDYQMMFMHYNVSKMKDVQQIILELEDNLKKVSLEKIEYYNNIYISNAQDILNTIKLRIS